MRSKAFHILIFLSLASASRGQAQPPAPAAAPKAVKVASSSVAKEVDWALADLRRKEGVSVMIKKKTVNSLLARERTSEGTLHFWQGRLRLEMYAPEESLLVLDGKTLWLANKMSAEMGGKTLVTKTSARSLKKSSTLIAALLENRQLLKEFKFVKRVKVGEAVRLEFAPKNGDSEILKLELLIGAGGQRLEKIVYWDDKENEVLFELGTPQKLAGDRKNLFSYKPPQDAEVTEI